MELFLTTLKQTPAYAVLLSVSETELKALLICMSIIISKLFPSCSTMIKLIIYYNAQTC